MNLPLHYYPVFMLLLSLLGAGCTGKTPQAHYYTLSSLEGNGAALHSAGLPDGILIGIGAVKFPDELDRSSIVTRSGKNRLVVDEFHRWGGALEKAFTRTFAENLAFLLKTDRIVTRPWDRNSRPDVRISLDIRQFTGELGEYALLDSTWSVFLKGVDMPAVVRRTAIKKPVNGNSYDALVAAQSQAVFVLCEEIAASLSEQLPVE